MDSNSNERKNSILLNSATILTQIKETSATNDGEWTEELKTMAKTSFVFAMSMSLLACALINDDGVLDTLVKEIDDRKALIDALYPTILKSLNETNKED